MNFEVLLREIHKILIKPCVTLHTFHDIQNNGQFLLKLSLIHTFIKL